ncbi:hypothetical protein F5X96DRAFT_686345 [Biscogniauxia mediterranea]|nr:hypothetical protein F5X96DRAFT_686345 [Biscogniauxia mediterranea]
MDLPFGPVAPLEWQADEANNIKIGQDLKSWIGILAPVSWFDEPRGKHIKDSLIMLYQEAIHVYHTCPALRSPAINDGFWTIVFHNFQLKKKVHSGANAQAVEAILTFLNLAFKKGMAAGQDGTRTIEEASDASLFHGIVHWLWLTEGRNYLVTLQGARYYVPNSASFPGPIRENPKQRFPETQPMNMGNLLSPYGNPQPAMAANPINQGNPHGQKRPRLYYNDYNDYNDQWENNSVAGVAPPMFNGLRDDNARFEAENPAIKTERDSPPAGVQQPESPQIQDQAGMLPPFHDNHFGI